MSYGPPKPPTTAYGDQDFIKEDWASEQPQSQTTYERPARLPTNSPPFGTPLQPIQGQHLQPPQPLPFDANRGSVDPRSFADSIKSLTQEDLLFMRSWRQDSFFYRGQYLSPHPISSTIWQQSLDITQLKHLSTNLHPLSSSTYQCCWYRRSLLL